MRLALDEARRAGERGEVPIGAVLILGDQVLAARGNERESRQDPTAHAEILVLRDAAAILGSWRLLGATVYVTVEPCPMCAGALVLARVARVVYGAADTKGGGAGSVVDVLAAPELNHKVDVSAGLFAAESQEIMQEFFQRRR